MDRDPLRAEVWRTVQALNRAWAKDGDPDRLTEWFHPRMVAITPSAPARLVGRDACVAAWKGFVEHARVLRWDERDPRVDLHAGDAVAVVTYDYTATVELGGQVADLEGRDMLVLVSEGGRWWVVADQFSPTPRG